MCRGTGCSLAYWLAIIKENVKGYLLNGVEAAYIHSFTWFRLLIPVKDKKSEVLDCATAQDK